MSLTDIQIWDLAKRMRVTLVFCGFKTELRTKRLQYNKAYIVNLEDEFDELGFKNEGTHYTCFQVNKYPKGKKQAFILIVLGNHLHKLWMPLSVLNCRIIQKTFSL